MESGGIGCGWQPAGFSSVMSIAYIALELVDKVHGLAVGMSSYRVSRLVHELVGG